MEDRENEDTGEVEVVATGDPNQGWLAREIGRQLREAREARGWGIRETARRSRTISRAMLGQVEKDGQNVALDKLEGVFNILELRPSLESVAPEQPPPPLPDPGAPRRGVIERFARLAPFIPEEELEILLNQFSLWERRHKPANSD